MKKSLLTVILIFVLISLLVSCNSGSNDTSEREVSESAPISENIPTTESALTESPVTEAKIEDNNVVVFENGASVYKIMRADLCTDVEKSAAVKFRTAFLNKFGSAPEIGNDWVKPGDPIPDDAFEILIGKTNRSASEAGLALIKEEDSYIIAVIGNKIVINANSDNALELAVNYFINTFINTSKEGRVVLTKDFCHIDNAGDQYVRDGWLLSVPSFNEGTLYSGKYDVGPGLANDSSGLTKEESYMQIVGKVSATMYKNYIEKLVGAGYRIDFENQVESNLYNYLVDDITGQKVYAYYNSKVKEARIIEDRSSALMSDFCYTYTAKETDTTTLYQYALYFAPDGKKTSTAMDCGMFYILKLADNSLFLIDSGHKIQATEEAMKGIISFMHEITGTSENEKIRIAGWFFTHPHGDHVTLAAKFVKLYHSQVDIERVMYNFPSYTTAGEGYDSNTFTMKDRIRMYFPRAKFMLLHTGEKINLADITINVIYTQEDAVTAQNDIKRTMSDMNGLSTVLKIEFSGKSAMFLGDINSKSEGLIKLMYADSTLKSDMVQVAHHGYNTLSDLYSRINPGIILFPNSDSQMQKNTSVYKTVKSVVGDANKIYFEHTATYGFTVVDGEIVVTERPRIGGEYDGSSI